MTTSDASPRGTSAIRLALALAALALAALGLGCRPPGQEGGLQHVDTAGFAGRLGILCSRGHVDTACRKGGPTTGIDAAIVPLGEAGPGDDEVDDRAEKPEETSSATTEGGIPSPPR